MVRGRCDHLLPQLGVNTIKKILNGVKNSSCDSVSLNLNLKNGRCSSLPIQIDWAYSRVSTSLPNGRKISLIARYFYRYGKSRLGKVLKSWLQYTGKTIRQCVSYLRDLIVHFYMPNRSSTLIFRKRYIKS